LKFAKDLELGKETIVCLSLSSLFSGEFQLFERDLIFEYIFYFVPVSVVFLCIVLALS
jgi:fatty acid-binding protein DegV